MSSLQAVLYSRKKFDSEKTSRELFEYFCKTNFCPDKYSEDEPIREPYNCNNLQMPIQTLQNQPVNNYGQILLKKSKPSCLFNIEWSGFKLFSMSFYDIRKTHIKRKKTLQEWVDFLLPLYKIHDVWFAYICLEEEFNKKNKLNWTIPKNVKEAGYQPGSEAEGYFGTKLEEGIPGIYWGNYFNKFYVSLFGEDVFNELPYIEKIELEDGGVFFTTAETPFDWNSKECIELQEKIRLLLGEDYFFDIDHLKKNMAQELGLGNVWDPSQLLPKINIPKFPFVKS